MATPRPAVVTIWGLAFPRFAAPIANTTPPVAINAKPKPRMKPELLSHETRELLTPAHSSSARLAMPR